MVVPIYRRTPLSINLHHTSHPSYHQISQPLAHIGSYHPIHQEKPSEETIHQSFICTITFSITTSSLFPSVFSSPSRDTYVGDKIGTTNYAKDVSCKKNIIQLSKKSLYQDIRYFLLLIFPGLLNVFVFSVMCPSACFDCVVAYFTHFFAFVIHFSVFLFCFKNSFIIFFIISLKPFWVILFVSYPSCYATIAIAVLIPELVNSVFALQPEHFLSSWASFANFLMCSIPWFSGNPSVRFLTFSNPLWNSICSGVMF